MAVDEKPEKKPVRVQEGRVQEGVVKYTKPPENKTPPSQRSSEKPKP